MPLEANIRRSMAVLAEARQAGASRLAVLVSGGRDSACLAHMVARSQISASFIHHYIVPDLEISEIPLRGLEQQLGIKITRVPSVLRQSMFEGDVLCINKIWDAQATTSPRSATFDRFVLAIAKAEWLATGIRKSESPMRMLALTKHPNPNPKLKKVYPLADWLKQDVRDFIEREKITISPSYPLMNRSFDSVNLKHVYPLKSAMPGDYKKICSDFPLMDALCWLYEKRVKTHGLLNLPEC
jgi:3'-phosphoadenosine 5'-phosphosulfate sulfotransferase (PAPS reductase)/FAD synthetase